MKKIIIISCIFTASLSSFQSIQAQVIGDSCNDPNLDAYELFECRKKAICESRKPKKMIYNTDTNDKKYLKLDPGYDNFLGENREKYRDNMNSIYKCALIQLQLNAIKKVKEKIESSDVDVQKKIQPTISDREKKLKAAEKRNECLGIENENVYNKANVLLQSSYEICKYLSYLDYLNTYSDTLSNVVKESTTATELASNQIRIKQALVEEQDHVIRMFPLAYTAYAQYETHISVHFMLELLREDFIVFRNRLHKILGPISQLLYKANNSMKAP